MSVGTESKEERELREAVAVLRDTVFLCIACISNRMIGAPGWRESPTPFEAIQIGIKVQKATDRLDSIDRSHPDWTKDAESRINALLEKDSDGGAA